MSDFVAFSVPVEAIFVCTGLLHLPFEMKYSQYHLLLDSISWRDPLPLVTQYVLIEIRNLPLFCQKNLSIPDGQCENVI